jgi:hypothetical protein
MTTIEADNKLAKERRVMHWMADAAVLIVLFGSMLSAWALVAVAGLMLVGLLIYAMVSQDPDRHRFAVRALIAAVIGGGVAGGVALLR